MAKDPAFLMYSKDWIEGTAELSIEAKGVYIDLLCYQHQKGDLPIDLKKIARLVRLSEFELTPIWDEIKDKFDRSVDRMVNRKLERVMGERSDRGKKNKLIGTFAHVLRKLDLPKTQAKELKKRFNVDELLKLDTEWCTERLTEWCQKGIPFIEDANVNIDYKSFIDSFNNKTGRKFKIIDEKTKRQLQSRLNEGFTIDDILQAAINCKNDSYHMENTKYLTPEFITRPDKLQTYLNAGSVKRVPKLQC